MGQKTEEPPTPRQLQLLSTIAGFQARRGYSPTIGELADRQGISRTTVFGHIEQLRKKGLVSGLSGSGSTLPRRARCLNLTSKARGLLKQLCPSSLAARRSNEHREGEIPLIGRVAAGAPTEAIENEGHLSINSLFGSADDVFALEVRGDSMADADIRSGDYVICRRTSTATDGQLVVAIVDNDNATLKRFYKEPCQARLQPANKNYEPIYSDNCQIRGVVTGLIRKL